MVKLSSILVLAVITIAMAETVSAALMDVSVGTDAVVYDANANVTISGYVRSITTSSPISSASVEALVDGSSIGSVLTDSGGKFNFTSYAADTPGTHTISITASKASDRGYVTGYYTVVEYEKRYTITTNKHSFSPGENVSVTFAVYNVLSNDSVEAASGDTFSYKIKTTNGTLVVNETSVTAGSDGTASTTYSIPSNGYGTYMIIINNGVLMDSFEVKPFSISAETLDQTGSKVTTFGTSDSVVVAVTATRKTDSNRTVAITSADVVASIKSSDGTTKYTFSNFTESSSGGVYTSETYSLSSLTNGDYYIDVQVTKSELTRTQRLWIKIKTLKIEFVPYSEKENVMGFLKGQNASLGMFVINMLTGQEISSNQILNATITSCKNMNGGSCLGSLSNLGSLGDGFGHFTKVFTFTAPNSTGEFKVGVTVTVNSSSGETLVGTGYAFISVQNIITFAETKDEFDNWRFDFGPGQTVKIQGKAYAGNWSEQSISTVEVVEIRDKDWNNVTSSINTTITGSTVQFDAPSTSGFYQVKLRITTVSGDVGYAGGFFMVRLYNIFVDTLDGSGDDASWKWQYGSADSVYFRFNVLDMAGNRISASTLKLELDKIVNEITQEIYTGFNVTELSADSVGRPGLAVNISNKNLAAGNYHAEFSVKDTDGNTEIAHMWFKVSNLNMWVDVKDSQGDWKWRFGPTDNITFTANAMFFNGSSVPDGSTVTIEGLFMMKDGPPIKVASGLYNSSSAVTSSGSGIVWAKAVQGKTLPQGYYMGSIKLTLPDGTTEVQDSWFEISIMDVNAYADPWSFSPQDNITIRVSVQKSDETPVEGANISLRKLRNANTWSEITLPSGCTSLPTDSDGSTTLTCPATGLNGNYEAEISISSTSLGATSTSYVWFEVKQYKISGWPVDASRSTYQAGETIEMWVRVEYPNSTFSNPQYITGANVSIYKFAKTENWPWTYEETVSMVLSGVTDSQGKCMIKFKAPSDTGRFNPMVQLGVSGSTYNSTGAWELTSFEVRSASVLASLFDNSTGNLVSADKFSSGNNITVEINVSNPTGADVNVSSIGLKYKDMSSGTFTDLQTLAYDLDENNYASFTAPTTEGDYVLYITVTDGSTGRALPSEKRWFKIQSFQVGFWSTGWSYSPNQSATINFDARTPTGESANFTVELEQLKDAWTWNDASYSGDDGAKNLSGFGTYSFYVPNNYGEFEAVFCTYPQGTSCSDSSQRHWMHFAVETFRVNTWSNQSSFTVENDVELNIELRYANDSVIGTSTYNASLIELKEMKTWTDSISLITVPSSVDVGGSRKTFTFSAENLVAGDYMARVRVETSSENRTREVWFRVSDANIEVTTNPQMGGQNRQRWMTGELISLNVRVVPAQDGAVATLKLMDNYGWREVARYESTVTGMYTYFNFTINQTSQYSAMIQISNAETNYWFEVGAYEISMFDWLSTHELRSSENVSVVFDVKYPNGTQYDGNVEVYVRNLRNPWDWSTVPGTENMFSTNVTAGVGNEQVTFSHGRSSGEYDCDLEFVIDGKSTRSGFWFMVKENMVKVWPDQRSYTPGSIVSVNAQVMYPNGTAFQGANVSIISVKKRTDWSNVNVMYGNQSMLTSANGITSVSFIVPSDKTGKFEVKLNISAGESSQIAFTEVQVSGYDAWFQMDSEQWSFSPGSWLNGTVYVFDSSKNPVSGAMVNITVKDDFWNDLTDVEFNGYTLASGSLDVDLLLDAANFTPGHYSLYISIDGGSAVVQDVWFKVESFKTRLSVLKEDDSGNMDYTDKFGPSDTIVISVEVLDSSGMILDDIVNSTLTEIRSIPWWENATGDFNQVADSVTATNGITRIKLTPQAGVIGEFNVVFNVTANISGSIIGNRVDAWIAIREFDYSISFVCPEGSSSYCDPTRSSAGGTLYANVTVNGNFTAMGVCMSRIRNIYTGQETRYGNMYCVNSSGQTIAFTAPAASGEYDAVFTVSINGQPMGDQGQYFRVAGSYDMNSWIEPSDIFAGNNATMWVEIWGPGWSDVNESQCSISLTELRDARNWNLVTSSLVYNDIGSSNFGPPGTRISFFVPQTLQPGDYMVKAQAVCGNSTVNSDGWFRVVIFQVASMLEQNLKSNRSAKLWIKVMNGTDGSPLVGANVTFLSINDDWTNSPVKTYNSQFVTDSNGEVLMNFVAPSSPGRYVVRSRASYGPYMQNIDRFFEVRALEIKMTSTREIYFSNSGQVNVILDVNVTDPINNSMPVPGANVQLQLYSMMMESDEPQEPDGPLALVDEGGAPGPQMFTGITNSSGIAEFVLNNTVYNFSSTTYQASAMVNTVDRGFGGSVMKTFVVKDYNLSVFGLQSAYNTSGTMNFIVNASYPNGTSMAGKYIVASLISMQFKDGGDQSDLNFTVDMTNGNGIANMQLGIPSNASSGPAFMIVTMLEGDMMSQDIEEEEMLVILRGGSTSVVYTNMNASQPVHAGEYIDVQVLCTNTNLALAPSVMHLEKTGGAVPMSQMMGGGPESGKESFYQNSILIGPNNTTHMKILTQKQPGSYMVMQPLNYKTEGFSGTENFVEVGIMEYTVI